MWAFTNALRRALAGITVEALEGIEEALKPANAGRGLECWLLVLLVLKEVLWKDVYLLSLMTIRS